MFVKLRDAQILLDPATDTAFFCKASMEKQPFWSWDPIGSCRILQAKLLHLACKMHNLRNRKMHGSCRILQRILHFCKEALSKTTTFVLGSRRILQDPAWILQAKLLHLLCKMHNLRNRKMHGSCRILQRILHFFEEALSKTTVLAAQPDSNYIAKVRTAPLETTLAI